MSRADNLSRTVVLYQVLFDTGQYTSELGLVQTEELFELLVIQCQFPHQSVVGPELLTTLEEFVNPPLVFASPSSPPRFDPVVAHHHSQEQLILVKQKPLYNCIPSHNCAPRCHGVEIILKSLCCCCDVVRVCPTNGNEAARSEASALVDTQRAKNKHERITRMDASADAHVDTLL